MKSMQLYLAAGVALVSAAMIAGVGFLAFIFPNIMVSWAHQERALSSTERTLVDLNRLCTTNGYIIMPALGLVLIASAVWALRVHKSVQQQRTAEPF